MIRFLLLLFAGAALYVQASGTPTCPAKTSWFVPSNPWETTTVAGYKTAHEMRGWENRPQDRPQPDDRVTYGLNKELQIKDRVGEPNEDPVKDRNAFFGQLEDVAISSDQKFALITDGGFNRIRRLDLLTNDVTTIAGGLTEFEKGSGSNDGVGTAAGFRQPYGIAISTDMIFALVVDHHNHCIRRIDLSTYEVTTPYGTCGQSSGGYSVDGIGKAAKFDRPKMIDIAPDMSFALVVGSEKHIIRRIDLATHQVTTVAGQMGKYTYKDDVGVAAGFAGPVGISISADAKFALVVDAGNANVRRLDLATWAVTTIVGGPWGNSDGVGTAARFNRPQGISISPDMSFALMTSGNHRMKRIDLTTLMVTTVVGFGSYAAGGRICELGESCGPMCTNCDGVGTAAGFYYPSGIDISPDSSFALVMERGAEKVRKVTIGPHCKPEPKVFGSGIATAPQRANLKLAHDNYVTNTKASFKAAEPLYKQAVVDFGNTFGEGSFLTKSAKKRYNILLARDSIKAAAEQALADNTPFAAAELVETKVHHQGRCASALPTSATYTAQSKRTVNPDMAGSVVLVTCADGLEATPEGDHVVVFLSCDSKLDTDLYEWVAHGTCTAVTTYTDLGSGVCATGGKRMPFCQRGDGQTHQPSWGTLGAVALPGGTGPHGRFASATDCEPLCTADPNCIGYNPKSHGGDCHLYHKAGVPLTDPTWTTVGGGWCSYATQTGDMDGQDGTEGGTCFKKN